MTPEGMNVGWGHEGGGGGEVLSNWGEDPSDDGPWGWFDGCACAWELEVWPLFEFKSGVAGVRVR
jgi:hypothetical protein